MTPLTRFRQWSPRAQARWWVCLLIAALSVGAGEGLSRQQAAAHRKDAATRQLQVAREMADRLSEEMAARARDVRDLSTHDVLRQGGDPAAMRSELERMKSSLRTSAWIGITDAQGTVLAATDDILVGQSIASRPVFQNGLKGLWTGDVHEAVMLARLVPHPPGEPVKFVDVAAPVRDAGGQVRGVLALHLSWQWASELRQSVLRPRGAARSLQLLIFDAGGHLLLPPEMGLPDVVLAPPRVAALREHSGVETWSDGHEALTSVAESQALGDFAGFGWQVVVRDTEAAAATSVAAHRPAAFGWALGAGVLALGLASACLARVFRPGDGEAPATGPAPPPGLPGRAQRRNDALPPGVAPARPKPGPRPAVADQVDPHRRDPLTGLWNRDHLPDTDKALSAALADGGVDVCVLCVELDGFSQVNERYGRAAGDDVIVQVARRLRQVARESDSLFRLDVDSFLLVLTCPAGEAAGLARRFAGRVLNDLQRPMAYRTLSNLRVSASVGAAVWTGRTGSLDDTVRHADAALQAAKGDGRSTFRLHAGATPVATVSEPQAGR